MKLFLLVSDRRSGTNNLVFMLGQYPEFLAAGEVFHHKVSYGGFEHFEEYLDFLGARIPLEPGLAPEARGAAIAAHAHAHPIRTVEMLLDFAEAKGKDHCLFKIFPGHLRNFQVDRIVGRFRPDVLFLLRTPLEAYVSLQKANRLKAWMFADTTGLRVTLDPEDYLAWHAKVSGFYRFVILACLARGLTPRILSYDELYKARQPPQRVLETVFLQMGLRLQDAAEVDSLKVQDKSRSVFETIENYDAFFDRLAAAGAAAKIAQFDLFGKHAYLEYAARALLGPLRRRR
jgi:hypothetical protein